ncbi:MAG: hypothetical protein NTX81_01750 [Candidatus Bathyarchaeota archaeon]|nr:hypothetical protein [Candidatus Bathyarchaeota archaeon]
MERISKEEIIRSLLFNYPQPTFVTPAHTEAMKILSRMTKDGIVIEVKDWQFLPTNHGLLTWGVTS